MNETTVPTPELYTDSVTGAVPISEGGQALLFGGSMLFMVFWFAIVAITIIAFWKIFTKAGEAGWKSLIPFYNLYVLLGIVGKPGWWLILFFIPFVNIIFLILTYHELSKAFGKGFGYTLGLIFLNPIFAIMLGFGSATYTKPGSGSAPPVPPQNPTSTPAM